MILELRLLISLFYIFTYFIRKLELQVGRQRLREETREKVRKKEREIGFITAYFLNVVVGAG